MPLFPVKDMSTRTASIGRGHRVSDQARPLLDDCRLQLASDNVFRFCSHNGMPKVPETIQEPICLLTAAEIEAARLAKKRALKAR
jgi:hypothetical protein